MFECTYVGDGISITPNPTAKMDELKRQVTGLQQQKDALLADLSAVQSKQSEVQRDIDAILGEIRFRSQESQKLEQEYAEREAVLASLLKKLEDTNILNSNLSNDNIFLQRQIEEEQKLLADVQDRRNKLYNELEPLRLAIEALESERGVKQGELDFLAAEYQRQGIVTQKAIEDLLKAEQEAIAAAKAAERKSEEARQLALDSEKRIAELEAGIQAFSTGSNQALVEENALLARQKMELEQENEFLRKKVLEGMDAAERAAFEQSMQAADQLSGIRMGLMSGDSRRTYEGLAGLGSLMQSGAKLTFDGKVIAGPGWIDAFRKQVRKPYNVPVPEGIDYRMPTLSNALNVTGTGLATFEYAALENRVGAKLSGLGQASAFARYGGKRPELIQLTVDCCPNITSDPLGAASCAISSDGEKLAERINGIAKHFMAVFQRSPNDDEIEYYGAMYFCARVDDPTDTNMSRTMRNIRTGIRDAEAKLRAFRDEGPVQDSVVAQYSGFLTTMPSADFFPGGFSRFDEAFRSRSFLGSILSDPEVGKQIQELIAFAKSKAEEATVDLIGGSGEGTGGGSRPPPPSADEGLSLGAKIGIGAAVLTVLGVATYYLTRPKA